eukprot:gene13450-28514_t
MADIVSDSRCARLLRRFGERRNVIMTIFCICFILCFMPLFLKLKFYEDAAGGAAAPVLSDLSGFEGGRLQRKVLLFSLIIPDTIILLYVIPMNDVALLVCIFHLRNALMTFAVLKHLLDYGGAIFKLRPIIITLSLFMAGQVLVNASAFTSKYNQHFFFAFIACLFIAFCILGVLVVQWLLQMFKTSIKDISDLSTSDLNINIFLIPAVLFGINYAILCVIYDGSLNADTLPAFLSAFTYTEAAFTVCSTAFKSTEHY